MENKKTEINPMFRVVNFNAAYKAPEYNFNKGKSWITWGKDNNYPKYLLDLFNSKGSSLHSSILHKKVSYIAGKGIEQTIDQSLNDFIERNDLNDEVIKMAYDFEIFNGFAVEVIWSLDGTRISSMKHIPVANLRFGLLNDEHFLPYMWYSKDWSNTRKYGEEPINMFNPEFPTGKQIYWYCAYNPANIMVDYPIPFYSNSINVIETDFQIDQFHLNQAKQGYAPSFILNFATGIPTTEEMDEYYRYFQANYAGTENAGKCLITYSENELQKPTFLKIDLNDSDERFMMLNDRIQEKIVLGHNIPPQLLILTPGKLAGTNDGPEKILEFKEDYVIPRQNRIEFVLNKLIKTNNYTEKITLKKGEVIPTTNGN